MSRGWVGGWVGVCEWAVQEDCVCVCVKAVGVGVGVGVGGGGWVGGCLFVHPTSYACFLGQSAFFG